MNPDLGSVNFYGELEKLNRRIEEFGVICQGAIRPSNDSSLDRTSVISNHFAEKIHFVLAVGRQGVNDQELRIENVATVQLSTKLD